MGCGLKRHQPMKHELINFHATPGGLLSEAKQTTGFFDILLRQTKSWFTTKAKSPKFKILVLTNHAGAPYEALNTVVHRSGEHSVDHSSFNQCLSKHASWGCVSSA